MFSSIFSKNANANLCVAVVVSIASAINLSTAIAKNKIIIYLIKSIAYARLINMINKIRTKDLAECIEKTIGFASQIKTGHRKMPPKYCIKVSKRFGIPLHELRPDIYPSD